MTTIFPKLKIHTATYFLFFTFLLTGHIKTILLIFLIVLVHEMGHIFFTKIFHYSIDVVEILPFGGLTKVNKFMNTPIKKDLCIYFGGIFFQLILFLLFSLFEEKAWIYPNTYQIFCKYNWAIFLFNLLPIRPLDGGEILRLFLEKHFAFQKAQNYANLCSIFFLFLFFLMNITFNLNNYVICSFLLVKIYDVIKSRHIVQHRFLLERFLYSFPYQKIHNEKTKDLNLLKKDTWHYFKEDKKYISEKELLQRKFDKHMLF